MSLRLLVVEDNTDLRQLLCEILDSFGYIASSASSAEHALELVRDGLAVDVLIADISLPGMSGIELATLVRRLLPDVEVIFASGYGDSLLTKIDFDAHFFVKPYDIDRLNTLLTSMSKTDSDASLKAPNV